jgi:hypothetical protein
MFRDDKLTKERRMCRHICALQHLRETAKCAHNVLDQLKCCCCALAERLRETGWVVWIARHTHPSAVHAAHSHAHTAHTTHTTVHAAHTAHAAVHRAHASAVTRVWRGVAVVTASVSAAVGRHAIVHSRVVRCIAIRYCRKRIRH